MNKLLPSSAVYRELGISRDALGWHVLHKDIIPAVIDQRGRCYFRPENVAALRERLDEQAAAWERKNELERFRRRFACMVPPARVPEPIDA